ncbi:PadR family transcriptional regulator [Thiotrichales bacterium 19X7-9]|nr:PadR family transcriptional regulator [Thiotrichales bacterium 19X7-9]
MARTNKTRYAILGALTVEPMSAYGIKMFMQRTTGNFWVEYEAQLYPNLKKLSQEEYVTFVEEAADKVGIRRVFHITEKGRELLAKWLVQNPDQEVIRDEFLLKIYYGFNVPKEEIIKQIQNRKELVAQRLKKFRQIKVDLDKQENSDRGIYRLLPTFKGIRFAEAELAWCDDALELLMTNG